MALNLRARQRLRFSETALLAITRPGPGHDHASRDIAGRPGTCTPARAVRRRGHSDHAREGPAEAAEAHETDVEADLGHRPLGLAQQCHRALEPAPLEIAVRRLAERLLEGPDEV